MVSLAVKVVRVANPALKAKHVLIYALMAVASAAHAGMPFKMTTRPQAPLPPTTSCKKLPLCKPLSLKTAPLVAATSR